MINPAVTRLLGFTLSDLKDVDSLSLIHAEDRPVLEAADTNGRLGRPIRVAHKDGSYRLLDVSTVSTLYGGRAAQVVSFIEVPDRSLDEQHGGETNRSLDALVESSPIPVFVKDADLVYVHINDAAAVMLTVNTAEAIGRRDMDLAPKVEALRLQDIERQVLNGQSLTTTHEAAGDPNPRTYRVHRFPLRDSDGRVTGLAGIGIDVTQQQLQHAQAETQRLLDGLFEGVPAAVLIVEPVTSPTRGTAKSDYRVVRANQAALAALRLDASSVQDARLADLFGECWQYGLAERIDGVAATSQGTTFEQSVSFDGHSSQWLFVTATKVQRRIVICFTDITQSRQAREALRRSEQNYREIFNSSTTAIFVHNAVTGEIIDVNNAVCEMYHARREDLLRLTIEDLSAGGDLYSQERAVLMVQRAFASGRHSFEWRARRRDGELFWVEVTLVPAVLNGETTVLAFVTDIEDRKRAEGGLSASESRFRAVFDHSGIGILLARGDGSIMSANPAFCGFGGYDEHEIRELNLTQLLHRSERRRFERQVGRVRKRVRPRVHVHVRLQRRDGSYYWAGITALLLPDSGHGDRDGLGEDDLILYMVTDISTQRHTEAALPETQEGFRALAESIPHLVWSLEPDGSPNYCNTQVFKYYGLAERPADLPEWHAHLHPDDAISQRPAWQRALSTGQEYVAECRLLRAGDQTYRWQLVRFVPVRDADGRIRHWFGTGTDVHDARDARDRVEELVELERGLRRELDHRVRNNLTSLITLIDLAGQTSRDAAECAGSIRARAETMATIHSLLTRSSDRTVDLRSVFMAFVPRECRGTLEIEGPEVRLNPSQADKVGLITNELMTNSIVYGALGARGGTVSIQWHIEKEHDAMPEACIWWRERGGIPQPATSPPGSGTKIIEGLVRFDLNGVVDLRYPPDGANHHIRFRLDPAAPSVISM